MSVKAGLSGEIRVSLGRLREEQSSINCARTLDEGFRRRLLSLQG